MKIKAEIDAYFLDDSNGQKFVEARKNDDHLLMVDSLSFSSLNMSGIWTKVGTATIEVDIDDDNKIKETMISTLRERQRTVKAAAQVKFDELEEKIQQLLAIDWNGSEG